MGLTADETATCAKCAAKITSAGTPTHANPPTVTGVPGRWWASWDGTVPKAALDAQAKLEGETADVTAKILAAKEATMAKQEQAAYTPSSPAPSFSVPEKPEVGEQP